MQGAVRSNTQWLELRAGSHLHQPATQAELNIALRASYEAMQSNADASGTRTTWQLRLLILGTMLFTAWHVVDILSRA